MNKSFATVAVLAVTGVLSICELCGPRARVAAGSASSALTVSEVRTAAGVSPQVTTQPQGTIRTVRFSVQGMTCGGCVIGTRTVLTRLPGVTKADVGYKDKKGTAVVTYDSAKVTVAQMVAAVRTLGYTATTVQ